MSTPTPSGPAAPAPEHHDGKGLAAGKIGLVDSVFIGLSCTAPLYSLVATLGLIVLSVGEHAPLAFIVAFVPMLCIAFAYRELNREIPDSGTAFTWSSKAFNPWIGWMAGWGILLSGLVVLANLAEVGGKYLLMLIGDGSLAEDKAAVTATGVALMVLMGFVSYRGVEIGAKMQNALVCFQFLALGLFTVMMLAKVSGGDNPGSTEFSWEWFNPFGVDSVPAMMQALILALFIYWGWDASLALNEETKDPKTIPGRSAVITTLILLVTYSGVTVVAMMYSGLGTEGSGLGNPENLDDVFFAIKDEVMGGWAWVLLLAVFASAASSLQTTILPSARGTLAMGVYKALPEKFSHVHPKYRTPAVSTLAIITAAIVYYVGMTLISENVLADSIASLGLSIAFYYAITGYACFWYYRNELRDSTRNLVVKGLFPLFGAVLLTFAFIQSAIDLYDPAESDTVLFGVGGAFVMGLGSLAAGALVMLALSLRPEQKPFFRGESLNRDTEVLVPEDDDLAPARPPKNPF